MNPWPSISGSPINVAIVSGLLFDHCCGRADQACGELGLGLSLQSGAIVARTAEISYRNDRQVEVGAVGRQVRQTGGGEREP